MPPGLSLRQVKRTTRLLLRSFVGPFVITFLVALFFLDMQYLWVYADEMIGKGLSIFVVLELLLYASARLVNLALPLAILMSSIMTLGSLAEHEEAFGEAHRTILARAAVRDVVRFLLGHIPVFSLLRRRRCRR